MTLARKEVSRGANDVCFDPQIDHQKIKLHAQRLKKGWQYFCNMIQQLYHQMSSLKVSKNKKTIQHDVRGKKTSILKWLTLHLSYNK